MTFTFTISIPSVFARFLREDCIEIKNKKWYAGEKPEEKSLRSTLTYFDSDYCLKKDNYFTIKRGEFHFNAMAF